MSASPRRILGRVGLSVGVVLLSIAAFSLSAFAHLRTPIGFAAVKDTMETMGTNASRGTVRVGAIDALPPDRMVLRDYRTIAPNGEVVIEAKRMSGQMDVLALFRGEIRFTESRFEEAHIRLTEGPGGQVNLVYASEVPDDRFGMAVIWEDIELVDNRIDVDLPGLPAITMTDSNGMAYLHVGKNFLWRLDGTSGEIDLPVIDVGFSELNGRLQSDHGTPLLVRGRLDLAIAEPGFQIDYDVPRIRGEEGEPELSLSLGADVHPGLTEEEEEAREERAEAREEAREEAEERREEAREEAEERREEAREEAEERREEAEERREEAREEAEEHDES